MTMMAMRETNWREEQQLSEVSDEAIADLTGKANRALGASADHVREQCASERAACTDRQSHQHRSSRHHLAHLHHDDMTRLIAERSAVIVQVENELPALQTRAEGGGALWTRGCCRGSGYTAVVVSAAGTQPSSAGHHATATRSESIAHVNWA